MANETFKDFKEKCKKQKIEITRDEFLKKSAELTSNDEALNELICESPIMLLLIGVYTASLCHALFDEESEEENKQED